MKLLVDIDKLDVVIKKLDETIINQKKSYNHMKKKIDSNSLDWKGDDARLFKEKWQSLISNDSEFTKQIQMLQSYLDYLSRCKNDYSKIKETAITRAKRLPQ